jgi:hypothetical protein
MCRNFTYEVVGQGRKLKAIKKIVAQKINVILFFDIEFFKYFFRVLHEASSSCLKFLPAFQKHPVYNAVYWDYHDDIFTKKANQKFPRIRIPIYPTLYSLRVGTVGNNIFSNIDYVSEESRRLHH